MRYMMMVKATAGSEAGVMPTQAQMAEMGAYNEMLSKAGVLVDLSGLKPTSRGVKIRFSGGTQTVTEGPFPNSDSVSGYWIIKVKSHEEALQWAMKAPNPAFGGDGEIEVRPFYELEDFQQAPNVES